MRRRSHPESSAAELPTTGRDIQWPRNVNVRLALAFLFPTPFLFRRHILFFFTGAEPAKKNHCTRSLSSHVRSCDIQRAERSTPSGAFASPICSSCPIEHL
jgi:hypothetical protein